MKPIYRVFYLIYRAGSGLWYWARRRFTLAGLCVAVGLLVAGVVGVDMENNVLYQEFALLLALLISAFASGRFFRAKFSATRVLAPLRYRRGTAALPCPVEKFDRAAANRADVAGGFCRSAPDLCGLACVPACRKQTPASVPNQPAAAEQSVPAGEPGGSRRCHRWRRAAKRK